MPTSQLVFDPTPQPRSVARPAICPLVVVDHADGVDAAQTSAGRCGIGVSARDHNRINYDLTVVGANVADAITHAGGWMFDRARAGWRISVVVTSGANLSPLQILGVNACSERDLPELLTSRPAAIAMSVRSFAHQERLRRLVSRALRQNAELTFWGEVAPTDFDCLLDDVGYRLSRAARAFKGHALNALSLNMPVAPIETFRSCALWYPPGPDLMPAGMVESCTQ